MCNMPPDSERRMREQVPREAPAGSGVQIVLPRTHRITKPRIAPNQNTRTIANQVRFTVHTLGFRLAGGWV